MFPATVMCYTECLPSPLSPLFQSSENGSLTPPGLQEALVDGSDRSAREPAVFRCASRMGFPAHHAEEGGFLFPPLRR